MSHVHFLPRGPFWYQNTRFSPKVKPRPGAAVAAPAEETPDGSPAETETGLADQPPLDEAARTAAVPDFLTGEQQALYRRALSLYQHLRGCAIEYTETDGPTGPVYETVEVNGFSYLVAQGRYARWDDFEAVVTLLLGSGQSYGSLVLHWEEGIVYGHVLSDRALSSLRADGSFETSGGAADTAACTMGFDHSAYTVYPFLRSLSRTEADGTVTVSCFADGQEVDRETFEQAFARWRERPAAEWHPLTEEAVRSCFPPSP